MSIILPESRDEILQSLQTDFVANIPESDPFVREHWLYALLTAIANREFDIYTQVNQLIRQLFPNTAEGVFARQWGNLKGVEINPATAAFGLISVTGTLGTVIPISTLWASSVGVQYAARDSDYTITTHDQNITSLTRSGSLVQAIVAEPHSLATGMTVTISGATETDYNGTYVVTLVDDVTFNYTITGTPSSPATGSPKYEADFASVRVEANTDTGNLTNLGASAQLTLINPIAGVDSVAYVQFTEVAGGSDAETIDEYRARYLERYQQQTAHFNEADIIATAKEEPGVTRVFVFRTTPQVGDVSVFFMRDDDPDPIPSFAEVNAVIERLSAITPANTPISDTDGLIVKAPTPQTIDFTFTTLFPNTQTMQQAIRDSLTLFFREDVSVSVNILRAAYEAAIFNAVDPATGSFVQSFNLSQPTGDVSVAFGNIGVLGDVTFNV